MLRWTKTRSARKFFRSRLALLALGVIFVYACLGTAVMVCGWFDITLNADDRVGMQNVPGFGQSQTPEKRLEDCELLLDNVENALKKAKPEEALEALEMGQVSVADLGTEQLSEIVEDGWVIYDQLSDSEDIDKQPELMNKLVQLEGVVAKLYPAPTGREGVYRKAEMLLGTDRQGRSIFLRALHSTKVALQIGLVTAFISVIIGAVLGAAAGYYGGWVDHAVTWLYTTFSSIPNIVLLVLVAYIFASPDEFESKYVVSSMTWITKNVPLFPVYVAFCATFWIGTCRVIRGETLKIKELEYVQAATITGFGKFRILLKHVLPNTAHLMLINFSLLFIGAIKSEVILTFLGLGVKTEPSWGLMISQSGPEVVTGFFWQIGAATAFMFVLVLAFNILSDALQDAFDPKHA